MRGRRDPSSGGILDGFRDHRRSELAADAESILQEFARSKFEKVRLYQVFERSCLKV
jgi:hypothetical protein